MILHNLFEIFQNPHQEVLALRSCRCFALVLVCMFFWDAPRKFLSADLCEILYIDLYRRACCCSGDHVYSEGPALRICEGRARALKENRRRNRGVWRYDKRTQLRARARQVAKDVLHGNCLSKRRVLSKNRKWKIAKKCQ